MFRCLTATVLAVCLLQTPPAQNNHPKPGAGKPAASQPASRRATRPSLPTQARIYEQLLRDTEPARPTIMSVNPDRPAASTGKENPDLMLEGTVLAERSGRLVRSGENTAFRFAPGEVGDNKAPLVLEFNKNGLLEAMEREAEAGVSDFVISAEVTRYRGRNYLNLLKYSARIDHGNLSP